MKEEFGSGPPEDLVGLVLLRQQLRGATGGKRRVTDLLARPLQTFPVAGRPEDLREEETSCLAGADSMGEAPLAEDGAVTRSAEVSAWARARAPLCVPVLTAGLSPAVRGLVPRGGLRPGRADGAAGPAAQVPEGESLS